MTQNDADQVIAQALEIITEEGWESNKEIAAHLEQLVEFYSKKAEQARNPQRKAEYLLISQGIQRLIEIGETSRKATQRREAARKPKISERQNALDLALV